MRVFTILHSSHNVEFNNGLNKFLSDNIKFDPKIENSGVTHASAANGYNSYSYWALVSKLDKPYKRNTGPSA